MIFLIDFQKWFQYHIVFQYRSKLIRVIELKKKHINFLFITVIYFPLSILMNILPLYYICYVILAMYMIDSDQEPSYNLSKNILLLPRILKLIEDMVNDSTPLLLPTFPLTCLNCPGLKTMRSLCPIRPKDFLGQKC